MHQLSRAKRLSIAVALLTVVFAAAAGTYFIAVTEARKRCTVNVVAGPTVWDTCLCAFTDVRKIEQPIIIDKPTIWACVDYALTTVNITLTGSLTVVNSSLRFPREDEPNVDYSMWRGLLNWGQLRIYSSRIGVSTVVEPSAEAVFEARDSNLTDTEALGGTTLLERVKPYYVTWGGFVRVSGAAQVTLMDSNFEVLRIEPMTSFIDIEGFNTTSLWSPTDYDFRAKWGLEQPFVRLVNATAENFELDVMAGRSALISNSQFTMSRVYGGFSSLILIHGGNVSLVNSKLETVWDYNSVQVEEDGLVSVRHSELGPVYVDSGDFTASSSKLHGLKLQAYQDETIKIDGFDEDRDGGNYNFTSWGFTHLHANTLSSNVQGVTVVSSGAKVTISASRLGGVSTFGGYVYVSDSQL